MQIRDNSPKNGPLATTSLEVKVDCNYYCWAAWMVQIETILYVL